MPFPTKTSSRKIFAIIVAAILATLAIAVPLVVLASPMAKARLPFQKASKDLPDCEIHRSMSCTGSSGEMDVKYKDLQFNTPPRNHSNWRPGFQDMSVLQGYPQLVYNAAHTECTVTIYTKTLDSMILYYYFDGQMQATNSKKYDSSYKTPLTVVVVSRSGEKLELDDIDFIWNAAPIKERAGDFRKGQKGSIIELFGWPDEDVAKECKFIADAGYLGVKLFPHQEQMMSQQLYQGMMNPWYFMYQPVSYRLQGRMGTRDQLRKTINTCRALGVRMYADSVVNHMTGAGNDVSMHRNPSAGCEVWWPKNSSASADHESPFYTHSFTYEINDWNNKTNNALEFPGVPYGPMDFHCEKSLNSWNDPNLLNTGWLVGLADLNTGTDYVRQRIADFFVDLLSIGFSGFRIDAAKHIHPKDLAAIFDKLKTRMGGNLPEDWITWLEVLTGGEASLLVRDSEYSYTTGLTREMKAVGLSQSDIDKVKIWWCGYPTEVDNDAGTLSRHRKVIQNDDHDQQSDGSSSRDMHGNGCVLVKGCAVDTHRGFEKKLFENPYAIQDNDNDFPIRLVLSSYYFTNGNSAIPDGKSDCSLCKITCNGCKTVEKVPAYSESVGAYSGTGYTRVHRDAVIVAAMRKWMHL